MGICLYYCQNSEWNRFNIHLKWIFCSYIFRLKTTGKLFDSNLIDSSIRIIQTVLSSPNLSTSWLKWITVHVYQSALAYTHPIMQGALFASAAATQTSERKWTLECANSSSSPKSGASSSCRALASQASHRCSKIARD